MRLVNLHLPNYSKATRVSGRTTLIIEGERQADSVLQRVEQDLLLSHMGGVSARKERLQQLPLSVVKAVLPVGFPILEARESLTGVAPLEHLRPWCGANDLLQWQINVAKSALDDELDYTVRLTHHYQYGENLSARRNVLLVGCGIDMTFADEGYT